MNTENAQTKKKYTHEELHELGIAHEHSHEHSHDHPHDHDGEHSHEHGHGEHGHHHVHSEKEKKAVVNRLAKAIGHLEAVKRIDLTADSDIVNARTDGTVNAKSEEVNIITLSSGFIMNCRLVRIERNISSI